MFGDAGHGLLLVAGGLCLPLTRRPWLRAARRVWPVIVAMGVAAAGGGLLYGEFFGPTAAVPTLWLAPVDNAGRLLLVGVAVGGLLLAISHVIGTANRWRESGPLLAMLSATGVAGLLVLAGITLTAVASAAGSGALAIAATACAAVGITMLATGILGRAIGGGGVAMGVVELLDALLRLGTNIISFTRLAAFGIMHAAIGQVVWQGTVALHGGVAGSLAAVFLFTLGNALAFALEALVAGVQALRLEYYELFSRVFVREGRAFRPWSLPLLSTKEA
jgi:V/A-type H+-transporting ATPase subunit I